jgi:hypothetical protein
MPVCPFTTNWIFCYPVARAYATLHQTQGITPSLAHDTITKCSWPQLLSRLWVSSSYPHACSQPSQVFWASAATHQDHKFRIGKIQKCSQRTFNWCETLGQCSHAGQMRFSDTDRLEQHVGLPLHLSDLLYGHAVPLVDPREAQPVAGQEQCSLPLHRQKTLHLPRNFLVPLKEGKK